VIREQEIRHITGPGDRLREEQNIEGEVKSSGYFIELRMSVISKLFAPS
jgi:hypothetical protein